MRGRIEERARVGFRPEGRVDEDLVRRAHVAHRAALFAGAGLPADALAGLCAQQHALQERHIATHNPAADRRMILAGAETVGRLCLDRTGATWRIVDVALLPEAQGRGLGGAAVRLVLAEAARAGAAVDLAVGRDNPRAEALYRRLGFVDALGGGDTHRRLIRPAGDGPDRVATGGGFASSA